MVSQAKCGTSAKKAGGELALIERIRGVSEGLKAVDLRVGIGDDCAVLRPRRGFEVVVTTDFSLEGRHFRREWHSAESVGHRTLARGLSDVAAMGARPMAAFLSLALPAEVAKDERWVDGFLRGWMELAREHGVPLAGGDTAEAPGEEVLADVVVMGEAPRGRALRRSGARVGDVLYCTGTLGGAAAELGLLQKGGLRGVERGKPGEHPHLFPQPRLAAGAALLRRGLASACIDVSDGLSTDLGHICEASGVGAEVEAGWLPVHPLAAGLAPEERMLAVLHGGEDYELLFTARAGVKVPRRVGGVAVTRIGRIVKRRAGRAVATLVDAQGKATPLERGGWEHFTK